MSHVAPICRCHVRTRDLLHRTKLFFYCYLTSITTISSTGQRKSSPISETTLSNIHFNHIYSLFKQFHLSHYLCILHFQPNNNKCKDMIDYNQPNNIDIAERQPAVQLII